MGLDVGFEHVGGRGNAGDFVYFKSLFLLLAIAAHPLDIAPVPVRSVDESGMEGFVAVVTCQYSGDGGDYPVVELGNDDIADRAADRYNEWMA